MNYYEILGVKPEDDITIIKARYKHLCKKYHPDITGNSNTERFISIKEAYDYISSKDNTIYDITLNIDVATIYNNSKYHFTYNNKTHIITDTYKIKKNEIFEYKNFHIKFNIIENPNYIRKNKDIYIHLPVEISIAIYGGVIEYTHIDGNMYDINIPCRINNNHKLKMKGMGMLYNNLGQRGDLIVCLTLFIDYENGKY